MPGFAGVVSESRMPAEARVAGRSSDGRVYDLSKGTLRPLLGVRARPSSDDNEANRRNNDIVRALYIPRVG